MGKTSINLEAKNGNEETILAYLNENASDVLAEKINAGNKTLTQCWNYIVSQAKEQATNGCACIADSEVYGWAIHFFEEDGIDGSKFNKKAAVKTATSKDKPNETYEETAEKTADMVAPKPKRSKKLPAVDTAQFSFDAMFG